MMVICLTGCPGLVYMWEVRTESTRKYPSVQYCRHWNVNLWPYLKRSRHQLFMAMRSASRFP